MSYDALMRISALGAYSIGLCAVFIVAASFVIWKERNRPHVIEISVFEVKNGISVFIRTPNDKRILVDGGEDTSIIRHVTDALPFYSRRIDAVFVTRADAAHATGLIDALRRFKIGSLTVPRIRLDHVELASMTDIVYDELIRYAAFIQVPLREWMRGDHKTLDVFNGEPVTLQALFPVSATDFSYSRASQPELVLALSYAYIDGSRHAIVLIGLTTPKIQKKLTVPESLGKVDAVITSKSMIKANVAPVFLEQIAPRSIIYAKRVSDLNAHADLPQTYSFDVTTENKAIYTEYAPSVSFNIKETGIVRIRINERSFKVSSNDR